MGMIILVFMFLASKVFMLGLSEVPSWIRRSLFHQKGYNIIGERDSYIQIRGCIRGIVGPIVRLEEC